MPPRLPPRPLISRGPSGLRHSCGGFGAVPHSAAASLGLQAAPAPVHNLSSPSPSLSAVSFSSTTPASLPHVSLRSPYTRPPRFDVSAHDTRSLATMASATSFYDFKPLNKRGEEVPLSDFKGKVVLIVNTASKCGFTPQYEGLETLYKTIKEKNPDDFTILGFPCNQFGGQEPGTDDDIQNFCQVNYGVSFPIMKKTEVNGDDANPLYEWLKNEKPGLMGLKRIKWNFEKFLIGRDGTVKGRWASTSKPESLEKPILEELAKEA